LDKQQTKQQHGVGHVGWGGLDPQTAALAIENIIIVSIAWKIMNRLHLHVIKVTSLGEGWYKGN